LAAHYSFECIFLFFLLCAPTFIGSEPLFLVTGGTIGTAQLAFY